ncbi:hypothetical protein [Spiroplasma endosymbiont of Atherix ibis]
MYFYSNNNDELLLSSFKAKVKKGKLVFKIEKNKLIKKIGIIPYNFNDI